MAWIIITANGEELDRRELLEDALVIGRSPECDVAVRDILLSRTHCRLEPTRHGWKVVDLNSKNGTRVGWQGIKTHVLRDGDYLRMGRTRISYHTTAFEPAPAGSARKSNRIVRPADPHEALTGTVTDFVLLEEEDFAPEALSSLPTPQPRPMEPVLDEQAPQENQDDLASSFWGSETGATSLAVAARTRAVARALPRLPAKPVYRELRRTSRGSETDLSLQVDATSLTAAAAQTPLALMMNRRQRLMMIGGLALAGALGTGIVVMSIWLLTLAP
jgi:predicted component of type VI protein secretion system